MRQIGTIENPDRAAQFAAYLTTLGTTCSVDAGSSGQIIWVQDEDRVESAKGELQRFLNEPEHERYRDATRKAAAVIRERQQKIATVRRQTIDVRDRWTQPTVANGPITFGLMLIMMLVGFQTGLDPVKHWDIYRKLVFSLPEIWHGEIWRLIAPIFLHSNIMHFLFNLILLRDCGLIVEFRIGSPKFLAMVLVLAVLSNYGQYLATGPGFGGMSGVNYGLFGYIWVRSKLDPQSGFWISQSTVVMMLGWFVLCIIVPGMNIANWAHGVGLALGAAMGASGTVWKSLTGQR